MQPSIRVTLLGGFAVTVNGVDCDVPAAASRLAAMLALRPRDSFRVEIAAKLWPDRRIVSGALRLRATTSPEIVEVDRRTVRPAGGITRGPVGQRCAPPVGQDGSRRASVPGSSAGSRFPHAGFRGRGRTTVIPLEGERRVHEEGLRRGADIPVCTAARAARTASASNCLPTCPW